MIHLLTVIIIHNPYSFLMQMITPFVVMKFNLLVNVRV